MEDPTTRNARQPCACQSGRTPRLSMITVALLILSLWTYEGRGCIYYRSCMLDWNLPNRTYDPSLGICESGPGPEYLYYVDFALPVESDLMYRHNLYCSFLWSVSSPKEIDFKFSQSSLTDPNDQAVVFSDVYVGSYSGSSFPTNYITTGSDYISLYFLSDSSNEDVGFGGIFDSYSPSRKRRSGRRQHLHNDREHGKNRTDHRHGHGQGKHISQTKGYRGQISDRKVIPQVMELYMDMRANRRSAGELCDYSCDARLLVDPQECCDHWARNARSEPPRRCPNHSLYPAAGELCPGNDNSRLRKRSAYGRPGRYLQ